MTLTRESDHQRGLRSVVGELIEHVRHYDIPDEPSYAAFVDAWADRIHAASGVPRMQQQIAEDRKAQAAVRAEQAAEVERLRAALEDIADRYVSDNNIRPSGFAVWAGERALAALAPVAPASAHQCPCPRQPWCVPHGWAGTGPEHHTICADHGHVANEQPAVAPDPAATEPRP